jgi:hypothetical protein
VQIVLDPDGEDVDDQLPQPLAPEVGIARRLRPERLRGDVV